jgi:hypothetical protein
MASFMTPPALPAWALPLACSMSERGAPDFLARLCSVRYSFLRHVICLNASFSEEPDWDQLASAMGETASDLPMPGVVANHLLKLPVRRLTELGRHLRFTPFVVRVLRKTRNYLSPFTYRDLSALEQKPEAACRMRALSLASELTQERIEALLELDPAFAHPAIAARVSRADTKRFNRIIAEIRLTCDPSAEPALIQALSVRHQEGQEDFDAVIRELVQAHYRIPTPAIKNGSRLHVIQTIGELRTAGLRLRNCLGSHVARRILSGEKLSVVMCEITDMVALLRPLACGARRGWLVADIGAIANRSTEQAEQEKFVSYLNTQLEEPVWRVPGNQKRRILEEQTDLQELFHARIDDI